MEKCDWVEMFVRNVIREDRKWEDLYKTILEEEKEKG